MRRYWIDLTATAVTVAADLLEITPATNKPVKIISVNLFQTTDLGDAAEEIIGLLWVRGHTTSGSGGSSPTPRPCDRSGASAGFTCEVFNTTQASAGTTHNLAREGWNIRVPYIRPFVPEEQVTATAADTTLILRMAAAPADSITISGSICVEEMG